jgi:hypothetical protein
MYIHRAIENYLQGTGRAVGNGAVICFSDAVLPIDAHNVAIPIGML